jgi:predicted RNase H-like HicB family nuclease
MGAVAEHRVLYTRTAKGEWVASVRGLRGGRARGKTLRQARQHLRIALAAIVDDPYSIDFIEDVRLTGPARRFIVRHWAERRKLDVVTKRADAASRAALEAVLAAGLNMKDAADLLGIPILKLQKLRRGSR